MKLKTEMMIEILGRPKNENTLIDVSTSCLYMGVLCNLTSLVLTVRLESLFYILPCTSRPLLLTIVFLPSYPRKMVVGGTFVTKTVDGVYSHVNTLSPLCHFFKVLW